MYAYPCIDMKKIEYHKVLMRLVTRLHARTGPQVTGKNKQKDTEDDAFVRFPRPIVVDIVPVGRHLMGIFGVRGYILLYKATFFL